MPKWLPRVLFRIRALASAGRVRFTLKALQELGTLSLDVVDAIDALRTLSGNEAYDRVRSAGTREWMYIFKPTIGESPTYVKVILRADCIVISFHEDETTNDPRA